MSQHLKESDSESAEQVRGRVREQIKKNGWTQKRLGHELGRSEGWVSRLLRGDLGMDVEDLIRIARVLKIQPAQLMPELKDIPTVGEVREGEKIAEELNKVIPDAILKRLVELRNRDKQLQKENGP